MRTPTLDPGHRSKRTAIRIVGAVTTAAGVVLCLIGLVSFLGTMSELLGLLSSTTSGPMPEPDLDALLPRYVWCLIVGIPLLGVGGALLLWGFAGSLSRFASDEPDPPATDAFHHMAEGTAGGVGTVSRSLGQGPAAGQPAPADGTATCPACNAPNDADATFCARCGGRIDAPRTCPGCGEEADADARYCDNCGRPLL